MIILKSFHVLSSFLRLIFNTLWESRRSARLVQGENGLPIAEVENIHFRHDAVHLAGWTIGDAVVAEHDGRAVSAVIRRGGVAAPPGTVLPRDALGFACAVPLRKGQPISLTVRSDRGAGAIRIESPRGLEGVPMAILKTATAIVRLSPWLVHYAATRSPRSKRAIWGRLGWAVDEADRLRLELLAPPDAAHAASAQHGTAGAAPAAGPGSASPVAAATIVVPIYDGVDLLDECLRRIEAHTDRPWHLVAVDDASPDPAIRETLRSAARRLGDRMTVIENPVNRGFVVSVNEALRIAADRPGHVVLLNTDAFVPPNWLSRLLAPIEADAGVASVTPMSNDAEIFSAPIICRRQNLDGRHIDVIDGVVRPIDGGAVQADAPTGVGFCMAMNIAFLRRVPQFDTVFGRGYGEEVDWAQRVRRRGGRHVGIGNLFVGHVGGASFGDAAKRSLLQANGRIISRRYRRYDSEVQEFILRDPLRTARIILAVAWAGATQARPIPIYVGHSWGGGAEIYLQSRIARLARIGRPALVIRVGGSKGLSIEFHHAGSLLTGWVDAVEEVEYLAALLPRRTLIVSCLVGADRPLALCDHLARLAAVAGTRLEVLFHDYFAVSPSYTLVDGDGVYRGVPDVDTNDPAHRYDDSGRIKPIPLAVWQDHWRALLAVADRLTVFSRASRDLLLQAYPAFADRIRVKPHRLTVRPSPVARPRHSVVVASLGNLSRDKGAVVVASLSEALAEDPARRLIHIGEIDPAYRLHPDSPVLGPYQVAELSALAEHHGVTHWLIPSVWPETFSFTTHEALATGLPVLCFDLGAQAEAVGRVDADWVVPFDADDPLPALLAKITSLDSEPRRDDTAA